MCTCHETAARHHRLDKQILTRLQQSSSQSSTVILGVFSQAPHLTLPLCPARQEMRSSAPWAGIRTSTTCPAVPHSAPPPLSKSASGPLRRAWSAALMTPPLTAWRKLPTPLKIYLGKESRASAASAAQSIVRWGALVNDSCCHSAPAFFRIIPCWRPLPQSTLRAAYGL